MTRRGFSLIEMMVAAAIAFVIVAAGSRLAGAMVHAVRKAEEQAELGGRAATTSAALRLLLGAIGWNWTVEQTVGARRTGTLGVAHCAPSTRLCPTQTLLPFQICAAATVDAATCAPPTTTGPDAITAIVPRDGVIEAVTIVDRALSPLPEDCAIGSGTLGLRVKGRTRAWDVDDLVLVANSGHVTVGRVAGAFASDGDPAVERVLDLDIGDGTRLADDDGGAGGPCSAARSLKGATVMRVKQVVVKLDQARAALVVAERLHGSDPLDFAVLVDDVEDFGARLELARLPGGPAPTGIPRFCVADDSAVLLGAPLTGPCADERLNADRAVAAVVAVVDLQLGVVLRSHVETQAVVEDVVGVFDRTAVIVRDRRLHRRSFITLGWPQ